MDRNIALNQLYEGLAFVSQQSRELGGQLHPELPLMTYSLLSFLGSEPGTRAVDIATAYGLDKSVVSRQVTAMEADGLVKRAGERPGRRGQVLELTSAGAQALHQAEQSAVTTLTVHLADWSDADIAALAVLLSRFAATSRSQLAHGPASGSTD